MKHQITLSRAIEMTTLYRQEKENILDATQKNKDILPLAETFPRTAIEQVLNVTDCESVRIYYGMSDDLKVHAILVPVDADDNDILPSQNKNTGTNEDKEEDDTPILEEAFRCPPICPTGSPLNP